MHATQDHNRLHRLLSSPSATGFAVSGGLALLVLLFVPVRYETNDDMGLLRGLYPGAEPLSPGGWISYPLKVLLHFLYDSFPALPWYGLFMYGCLFLGLGLVLSVMIRCARARPAVLLLVPVVLMFALHLLILLNFTAPTLLLLLAALLCLMEWALVGCPVSHARLYKTLLVLTMVLGVGIRQGSVLLALPVLSLPLLALVKPRQLIKALPLVIILAGLFLAEDFISPRRSPEAPPPLMGESYHSLRSAFHDTIAGRYHGEQTRRALNEAGWTMADYEFFQRWILYDQDQFNADKLELFLQVNDPGRKGRVGPFVQRLADNYRKNIGYVNLLVLGAALLLVIFLGNPGSVQKRDVIKAVLVLGWTLGFILALMVVRFKPRVYLPLFMYFLGLGSCFAVFLAAGKDRAAGKWKRLVPLVCVILLILVGAQVVGLFKVHVSLLNQSKMRKEHIFATMRDVASQMEGQPWLMVMDPALGLGLEYVHPLREWREVPDLRILPSASSINSRSYFALLDELGLSGGRELMRWTVNNPDVLLPLFAQGSRHGNHIKGLWESYMNRRVMDEKEVRIIPRFDFRNPDGWGMVYYAVRSAG